MERNRVMRPLPLVALTLIAVAVFAQNPQGVRFTATSENVSGAGEQIRINLTSWSTDAERADFVAAWTMSASTGAGAGGRGGRGARGPAGGRGTRGARGAPAAADLVTPAAPEPIPDDPNAVDPDNSAIRSGRGGGRGRGDAAASTPEASLSAALKRAPTLGALWTSETVGYSIKYAYRIPQPDGGERIVLATDRRIGAWSNLWKPVQTGSGPDYPFSIIELRMNSKGEGEGKGVIGGQIAVDTAKTIALGDYPALPVILKGVKRSTF
jgi:hypothetical protein